VQRIFIFAAVLIGLQAGLIAQQAPFWSEILAFSRQDEQQWPGTGMIVFTGSSSIRMWKTLEQDFSDHRVLNRGFGGSTLPDVIRYAGEVILKYQPGQVVIYCGENDLAADSSISGKTVFKRFKSLTGIIRDSLPDTKILFIALKPSPSRIHLMEKIVDANRRIRRYIKSRKYLAYADVFTPMLGPDGLPPERLFIKDRLHLSREGYEIWKETVKPFLIRD